MKIGFSNDKLKELHLCLNALKLDVKGASVQLLGAYAPPNIPGELVDADFVSRGRLADALTNWLATQSIFKGL